MFALPSCGDKSVSGICPPPILGPFATNIIEVFPSFVSPSTVNEKSNLTGFNNVLTVDPI